VAFHTTLALKEGIDPADVQAIRDGRLPKDSKLAALSGLAKTMIEKRGHLGDEDINRFLAAGLGKDHLLEVIAAVAASTITNYTGSIAKPPLDAPFEEHPGQRKVYSFSIPVLWHGNRSYRASRGRRDTRTIDHYCRKIIACSMLIYPTLLYSTLLHSHSILTMHCNANAL
jgi:hypothetical protein